MYIVEVFNFLWRNMSEESSSHSAESNTEDDNHAIEIQVPIAVQTPIKQKFKEQSKWIFEYGRLMGGVQLLENKSLLMNINTQSFAYAFEVESSGSILWKMEKPNSSKNKPFNSSFLHMKKVDLSEFLSRTLL